MQVQKHALLTVQKLMLGRDKLDFLKRPPVLTPPPARLDAASASQCSAAANFELQTLPG